MALPELLQWLGNSGKTGTLEVERNKVVKHIVLKDGAVIACSTNEKTELLGNFLLARGKINEETLRNCLTEQETSRRHLGEILVERGILGREELAELLSEKAEETIFSLFDWQDAAFRFHDSVLPTSSIFPVNLRVDEILMRGAHRLDEIERIRTVFPDPGFVVARTGKEPPDELMRNRTGRTIFELINGDRSIAEILLYSRCSEYAVYKLLFEMFRAGLVIVKEEVQLGAEFNLDEDLLPDEPGPFSDPSAPAGPTGPLFEPVPAPAPVPVAPAQAERPASRTAAAVADPRPSASSHAAHAAHAVAALDADAGLEMARKLLDAGEFDTAMDVLDRLYRSQPNHDSLRRLLAEAEAAFIHKAYKHYLPATKVPRLIRPLEELTAEEISPAESFLLTRMDGTWDVKSIIQICPLREVDALRALKRMRERGIIDFVDRSS